MSRAKQLLDKMKEKFSHDELNFGSLIWTIFVEHHVFGNINNDLKDYKGEFDIKRLKYIVKKNKNNYLKMELALLKEFCKQLPELDPLIDDERDAENSIEKDWETSYKALEDSGETILDYWLNAKKYLGLK